MKKILFLVLFSSVYSLSAQNANRANWRANDFLKHEDPESALPFLVQAAELDHSEAQFNLAYLYQKGLAVEQNDSLAHYWYLKSARNGAVNAQFKVAYNYASGRGVKKAPDKSFYWTLKCAKQNDPECISNVVACYSDGFGVVANEDSALAWTIRAACLPDLENLHLSSMITGARISLAQRYSTGDNPNYFLAYQWYLIYNESKRDYSIIDQQRTIDEVVGVELRLTDAEIAEAPAKAEKILGRKLKNISDLHEVDH